MPLWQPPLPPSPGDTTRLADCSDADVASRSSSPFSADAHARASRPPRLNVLVAVPAVDAVVDMAAAATAAAAAATAATATATATAAATAATAITTTASNPVSPGPPSPSPNLEARPLDFVPPTRPSSTPFPQPDQRIDDLRCLGVLSDDDYMGDLKLPVPDDADVDVVEEEDVNDVEDVEDVEDVDDVDDIEEEEEDDDIDDDDPADTDTMDAEECNVADDGMDICSPSEHDCELDDSLLNILASAASLSRPLATPKMDLDLAALTTPPLSRPSSTPPDACKTTTTARAPRTLFLQNLPVEIQVLILDLVFECPVSPMMKSWPDKRLTKLASFTPVWRNLVQERLYCRLKLKAAGRTLADAAVHFARYRHLRQYVKHVELWFPVFEPKPTRSVLPPLDQPSNSSYVLPSDNCSLEEAFFFLSTTFPELSVLTLEGGERKKAPQARLFRHRASSGASSAPTIPPIKSVRTLVCKGQWNLIRCARDFEHIAAALPSLVDWRGSYSKPKSKSYLSMATILPNLPTSVTSLDLCLEGDFRQEIAFPPFFLKVASQIHFCAALAHATPALKHLSYTGRVCRSFFDLAAALADPRLTRLTSVELNVKNCCRHISDSSSSQIPSSFYPVSHWHESGSGATDINFIRAFEALVLSGVRALEHLSRLDRLRIRYVDLEFPVPPLNPFFLLERGVASGVWSDTIVAELDRVRPAARWAELSETIGERTLSNGRVVITAEFPKRRVISLKLSNYAFLVALVTTP